MNQEKIEKKKTAGESRTLGERRERGEESVARDDDSPDLFTTLLYSNLHIIKSRLCEMFAIIAIVLIRGCIFRKTYK